MIEAMPNNINNQQSRLRIIYWNAESISNKFDQLNFFLSNNTNNCIHIVLIVEAKLANNQKPPTLYTTAGIYSPLYISGPSVNIHNSSSIHNNPSHTSGGMLVYMHETITTLTIIERLSLATNNSHGLS